MEDTTFTFTYGNEYTGTVSLNDMKERHLKANMFNRVMEDSGNGYPLNRVSALLGGIRSRTGIIVFESGDDRPISISYPAIYNGNNATMYIDIVRGEKIILQIEEWPGDRTNNAREEYSINDCKIYDEVKSEIIPVSERVIGMTDISRYLPITLLCMYKIMAIIDSYLPDSQLNMTKIDEDTVRIIEFENEIV